MSFLNSNFSNNFEPAGKYTGKTPREQAIDVIESFGVPKLMYIGLTKETIGRVSTRQEAHWTCNKQNYISLNMDFAEHRRRRVIVIDIDDRFEDDAWGKIVELIQDGKIPMPSFASTRLETKSGLIRRVRGHLIFPLQYPVNEGEPKQKFFMDVVLEQFYDVLQSHGINVDRRQNVTLKNPAASAWDVVYFGDNKHKLTDWADLFGISILEEDEQKEINKRRRNKKRAARAARHLGITGERNVTVFDVARYEAYAAKDHSVSFEHFRGIVDRIVREAHNSLRFPELLSGRDLTHIAKSIARWTWYVYSGSGDSERDRGACSNLLTREMDTSDRQRIGAGYTHDKRAHVVLQKLKAAYESLLADGQKVSVRILATTAGVSASTAQKYRKIIESQAEYTSKAETFAAEIKGDLYRTAPNSLDSTLFQEVYCDGASGIPRHGATEEPDIGQYLNIFLVKPPGDVNRARHQDPLPPGVRISKKEMPVPAQYVWIGSNWPGDDVIDDGDSW